MADTYSEIMDAAHDVFKRHRFNEAALLYEKAYRHAKEFKLLTDSFHAGVRSAVSWALCGQSVRALSLVMQLLQAVPPGARAFDLYWLKEEWFWIRYLSNPDLVKLTSQLGELEALVNENPSLPQGDIPHMRSRLFAQEGRFDKAVEQAELAWAKHSGNGLLKSSHAISAISCNLRLSKIESAKHWLKLLIAREREPSLEHLEVVECRALQRIARVYIALWDQRYQDADTAMQEFAEQIEETQAAKWRSSQREFGIRTLLLQRSNGDPLRSGHPALALLARYSLVDRTLYATYERFRLQIDYRLAALRFAVGMEPVDDLWYTKKQVLPTVKITPNSNLQDRILRTRRACKKALRHAQYLDEVYKCDWRQQEIRERLERLDEIVTAILS